jgi:hypothetical protein
VKLGRDFIRIHHAFRFLSRKGILKPAFQVGERRGKRDIAEGAAAGDELLALKLLIKPGDVLLSQGNTSRCWLWQRGARIASREPQT